MKKIDSLVIHTQDSDGERDRNNSLNHSQKANKPGFSFLLHALAMPVYSATFYPEPDHSWLLSSIS